MRAYRVAVESHESEVVVYGAPLWAQVVSAAADWLCGHTGHAFCGCGWPDWFWLAPFGGVAYRLFGRLLFLPDRHARVLTRYAVSVPVAVLPRGIE